MIPEMIVFMLADITNYHSCPALLRYVQYS
jgi:hypothetical protein